MPDSAQVQEKLGPGAILLVTGPSGSGKDTLLREAGRELASNRSIVFPRRQITRESDPEAEDHDTLTFSAFESMRKAGEAAFCWEAHGHGYVIPKSVVEDVKAGRAVVFNASRTIIDEACRDYANVGIVRVEVPPGILAARIAQRGRESAEEIEARLARRTEETLPADGVVTIDNSRSVEEGTAALVKAIRAVSQRISLD